MKRSTLLIGMLVIFFLGLTINPVFSADLQRFKGKKITVTCWSGAYAEDFKKSIVEPFMKESGAIVLLSPGWSEFISKIKASPEDKPPYDVFMADGWNYIAAMNIKRLQPIRKENIPNAKDIYPELLKKEPWVKGYGVPFDGGLYLPVYVPGKIDFTPTAWKDMLRPELKGKLTFDQTFYYGLYAAAFISQMAPGAQELYTEKGIDECFKVSKQIARSVRKFYKGGAEFFSLLRTGEAIMGAYYSGGTISYQKKGMNIAMVIPNEGVVAWIGYLTVLKGARNRDLCEAFINYCMDAKSQSRFAALQGDFYSNARSRIPENEKGVIPTTNTEFKHITFFDWDLLNKNWGKLEERWKKEVLTEAR
jgi:spermidine/putrescine-binding protein